MGNANGRGDLANGGPDDPSTGSNGELRFRPNYLPNSIPPPARLPSPDLMANSPPASPARFRSPHMFAPQVYSLHFTPLLQLIDYVNHSKIKILVFVYFLIR
ncbi:hypothetical protein CsSME_00042242 [Camellia sinensis var. sinensis]